ncbi:MAG: Ku protein [Rhodospirillales bacterium]|nr:Ku protein [Rhodospirillales bacterium]MBN8906850.1 Ku protein [Rhodospirillales bacterium]
MATRPIWRGHLRLALVSCPVALHSVVRSSGTLRFHYINPKTGNRVRMVTLDAETDEELARRDLVKGYEFEKDRYVLMEDEDFDAARIESSSTLTVAKFVERTSIPPVYFDTSYYLVPDGDAGQDVFVVLRDAIERSGQAALSRVVIGRRERAVAILPMGKGMVCHTLHEPRDLYSAEEVFGAVGDEAPDAEMVKLATQLIDRQEGKFEPADTEDRYETRLREVIDAKLRGEGISPDAPEEPDRSNVIDLMAALKASLGRGEAAEPGRGGRASAKSAAKAAGTEGTKAGAEGAKGGGKGAAKKAAPTKAAPRKAPARKAAAKASPAKAPARKRA